MAPSRARDPDALVVARFVVAAIDAGSQITLRERTAISSVVAPSDMVRALSRALNSLVTDSEAIDHILQHAVTIPEAARLSGYSESDILARIERGEIGGLCIDGVWLVSRSCAQKPAGLTEAEKYFKSLGYKGFG
jgi:hypothetical protein